MTAANPFAELPIVIRARPSGVFWRVAQLLVLAIAGAIVADSSFRIDETPLRLVLGLAAGVCLLLELMLRVRRRRAKVLARIDRTGVAGTAGKLSWREPLGAYEGVLWREFMRSPGGTDNVGSQQSRRITILELRHRSDAGRTVRLLRSKTRRGVRARWEAAARSLGLPALRELADGRILARRPEDLDTSLGQLVRDGRLERPRPALLPLPADVDWDPRAPRQARVRQAATFLWAILIASCLFPLAAVALVLAGESPLALIVAPAPLAAYAYKRAGGFLVAVAGDELRIGARLGRIALRTWRFPLEEIEQVWEAPVTLRLVEFDLRELWVESDRRSLRLWPLSRAASEWLVRFLLGLVVDAPAPR